MECVDRTLRKLLDNDLPFGGKVMVFCGDFRQVAPVIPRAGRAQIVSQALTMSQLWDFFATRELTINERINQNPDPVEKCKQQRFAKFLLDIGDGRYPNKEASITLPREINCAFLHQTPEPFIESVFGKLSDLDPHVVNPQLLNRARSIRER